MGNRLRRPTFHRDTDWQEDRVLGEELRRLRDNANLTQREVAALLVPPVSASDVSAWERGCALHHFSPEHERQIRRICKGLSATTRMAVLVKHPVHNPNHPEPESDAALVVRDEWLVFEVNRATGELRAMSFEEAGKDLDDYLIESAKEGEPPVSQTEVADEGPVGVGDDNGEVASEGPTEAENA